MYFRQEGNYVVEMSHCLGYSAIQELWSRVGSLGDGIFHVIGVGIPRSTKRGG